MVRKGSTNVSIRVNPERALTRAEICKRHRLRHPDAMPAYKFKHRLKKKGLTLEAYETMLRGQNGQCALCPHQHVKGDQRKSLVVDHCHASGKIRGLLCHSCNRAIGLLKDDAERVQRAADYLRRNQ